MNRRDFTKLLMSGAALSALPATAILGQTASGGLVALVNPEPATLSLPLNQQNATGLVGSKIYEGLLDYDFDLTPRPLLADSWEVSEDGLVYTFHLVQNATWHDGEPFTAHDVVFSCAQMLPETHPRARGAFARCESIEALDDHTVRFTLRAPFAAFLYAFETTSAPMVPRHLYEGTDYRANPANDTPIGTGPFRFAEWERGSHIHLLAYDGYYREGQPGLSEIYFQVIPDSASRAVALESGQAQFSSWGDIESFDVIRLGQDPNLVQTTQGYEFASPISGSS